MNRESNAASTAPQHFVVLFFPSSHVIDQDFADQAQRAAAALEAACVAKPVPIKSLKVQVGFLVRGTFPAIQRAMEDALASTSPYFIARIESPCAAPGLRDTQRYLKAAGLSPP